MKRYGGENKPINIIRIFKVATDIPIFVPKILEVAIDSYRAKYGRTVNDLPHEGGIASKALARTWLTALLFAKDGLSIQYGFQLYTYLIYLMYGTGQGSLTLKLMDSPPTRRMLQKRMEEFKFQYKDGEYPMMITFLQYADMFHKRLTDKGGILPLQVVYDGSRYSEEGKKIQKEYITIEDAYADNLKKATFDSYSFDR